MRDSQVCSIADDLVPTWCLSLILGVFLWQSTIIAVGAPVDLIRTNQQGLIVSKKDSVEYRAPGAIPVEAATNQVLRFGDALQTHASSRAEVRLTDWTYVKLQEHSLLEIIRDPNGVNDPILRPLRGQSYIATGGSRRKIPVQTTVATGTPQGTEFLVRVDENVTEFIMLDGEVVVTNKTTTESRPVTRFHRARVERGKPIEVRPILATDRIVQWWIYYPGVVDSAELFANMPELPELRVSLAAYRAGDLLKALRSHPGYPEFSTPTTDNERAYIAALLLAVGATERAEAHLAASFNTNTPPVRALRLLVHSVAKPLGTNATLPAILPWPIPNSASEWMALSYAHQSANNLAAALRAARSAAAKSPNFGFAWARVAELEFSFGNTRAARSAIDQALQHSPSNAQAHCVRGFLLAADYKVHDALAAFDTAIEIDPGLGNAWLGRGLCKRRLGIFAPREQRQSSSTNLNSWLSDLQAAAMMEPGRSLTRAYAGKAFSDAGEAHLALKELDYAAKLDPNDPTPPLYKALELYQQNRPNEAVRELERSIELNDNRAVYRSRLLLDEDQAVRSAGLAKIYHAVGLADVAVYEATRAVASDYGNYSAHQFLAESYNELSDPNLINLRYESARVSEYLLANLLAPVGGSRLSTQVSQQEYSKLFAQDRLGFSSQTTYLSHGGWQQQASQYGWLKNTGYSLDLYYRSQDGERPNNHLEQSVASIQLKQQLTPQDSLYFQAVVSDFESGDVRQLFDQQSADPNLRINEHQTPNAFLGYHHEWSPGMHTLLLGSRLEDRFSLSTANIEIPGVIREEPLGPVTGRVDGLLGAGNETFDSINLRSSFEIYSIEMQQITRLSQHTFVVGARYQTGETWNQSDQTRLDVGRFPPYYSGGDFVASQSVMSDLTRLSAYGYEQWHILEPLWLTTGLSYDELHYPRNTDRPPISKDQRELSQVSPKAGFVWTPADGTTLRGAFTRSLGGIFYDSSVRLEPVQIAGYNQAYRSLIPESVEGAISGSQFQTFDLGFEQKFKSRTFFVLQLELLQSAADRMVGAFDLVGVNDATNSQLRQSLNYEEQSLSLSLNQLVGSDWSVGLHYKLSDADLTTSYPGPDLPQTLFPDTHINALLHALDFHSVFNHSSGFFAEAQALWRGQSNRHDDSNLAGDDFWQFNLYTGYRFLRRQAELTVGVLNLSGQDYHLNPLNIHQELPHERNLLVRLKLNF